ncbi:MAG: class I SAM-dependent methyltransferase [Verrucomicrobiota bacterium]
MVKFACHAFHPYFIALKRTSAKIREFVLPGSTPGASTIPKIAFEPSSPLSCGGRMFFKFANNTDKDSVASRMRQQRLQRFLDLIPKDLPVVRILDVGGTSASWAQTELPANCEVTLLNLEAETAPLPRFTSVAGDARKMPQFRDRAFDLGYSNSVIEHVGTLFDQMAMAAEIRRICRGYFVQTPNRHFPLEPHFLIPCWQYLPVGLRRRWLQNRDLGWMKCEPDPLRAQAEVEQIRLLTAREMRLLFPDAKLWRERLGPFTKSLVAWKAAP